MNVEYYNYFRVLKSYRFVCKLIVLDKVHVIFTFSMISVVINSFVTVTKFRAFVILFGRLFGARVFSFLMMQTRLYSVRLTSLRYTCFFFFYTYYHCVAESVRLDIRHTPKRLYIYHAVVTNNGFRLLYSPGLCCNCLRWPRRYYGNIPKLWSGCLRDSRHRICDSRTQAPRLIFADWNVRRSRYTAGPRTHW